MALKDFAELKGVQLLQRSLRRGRLAHAYLFTGGSIEELEAVARTLAKTLNCAQPLKQDTEAIDCCDQCLVCRKIDHANHADIHWVRPESKSRVITIDQMRELLQQIHLKPTEAKYKVAVIVGADRLNTSAANAFLKTLEEPPPASVLILLTTEPQRLLETIVSRCLRLNFGGETRRPLDAAQLAWLTSFSEAASAERKSLMSRYRLMDVVLKKLTQLRENIDGTLSSRSPLQQYPDAEKDLQDRWEGELKAAIEAEYRRQRADLLITLEWWLRDVWLRTLSISGTKNPPHRSLGAGSEPGLDKMFAFPEVTGTVRVAERISSKDALANLEVMEQMQRWLHTNVQEALALEVGFLKLHL